MSKKRLQMQSRSVNEQDNDNPKQVTYTYPEVLQIVDQMTDKHLRGVIERARSRLKDHGHPSSDYQVGYANGYEKGRKDGFEGKMDGLSSEQSYQITVPPDYESYIRFSEHQKQVREHNWKIDVIKRLSLLMIDFEVIMQQMDDVAIMAREHKTILEGLEKIPHALGGVYISLTTVAEEAGWLDVVEGLASDVDERITSARTVIAILSASIDKKETKEVISPKIKEPMAKLREIAGRDSPMRQRLIETRRAIYEELGEMNKGNIWLAENWAEIKPLRRSTKDRVELLMERLESDPPAVIEEDQLYMMGLLNEVDQDTQKVANYLNKNLDRYSKKYSQ